jgi:hypothetical protein
MGFGKKKTDAAQVLGRLSVEPWEQEPLTEVEPLRDGTAPPSGRDDREGVKVTGVQDTK